MTLPKAIEERIDSCFSRLRQLAQDARAQLVQLRSGQGQGAGLAIDLKAGGEAVTDLDRALERALVACIRAEFPDHGIVGEEGTFVKPADNEHALTWLIDPIDNTVGLIAGENEVAVSIALQDGPALEASAVFVRSLVMDLVAGDTFEASSQGAWRQGNRLRTCASSGGKTAFNVRGISTCAYVNPANQAMWCKMMTALLAQRCPVRISGCAALDLCKVAMGARLAHVSLGAHPWDVAAGLHMVQAAGGAVKILRAFPERNSLSFIAACNREVCETLSETLALSA